MVHSDVCLILEGTYPYVTGGVSAWVHNLLSALSHIKFSLVVIVPSSDTYKKKKYDIPANVVYIHEVYIQEYKVEKKRTWFGKKKVYETIEKFYDGLADRNYDNIQDMYRDVINPETRKVTPYTLLHSMDSWNLLLKRYKKFGKNSSFLDFFWTWRFSHLALIGLTDEALPEAKVYHAVSTGYASIIGLLAHFKTNAPFVLTEHGIYTNERRIEIEQADWIYEKKVQGVVLEEAKNVLKQYWISFFEHIGRLAYEFSEEIITLSEKNRQIQIVNGAAPRKTRVIPNGVNLNKFAQKRPHDYRDGKSLKVGFVGRVVPVKDIRTLVRAFKLIKVECPTAELLIMGPYDEDPEYYEECRKQIEVMELSDSITFTGRVDVLEAYLTLDVVVLTSISEGQPLVILEANCMGVPCVATDVGACDELLTGRTAEDIAIGPSGLLTPIFSPRETADAVVTLLKDQSLNIKMGENGIKRVETHYNEKDLNFAYLDLYQRLAHEFKKRQRQAMRDPKKGRKG